MDPLSLFKTYDIFIDRMNSYNDLYLFLLGSNPAIGNPTSVNPSNTGEWN